MLSRLTHRAYGARFASLRYFNAAGADEGGKIGELHPETHLVPCALLAASGARGELELFGTDYPTSDGTCVRDYIHLNAGGAHALALRESYNLGSLLVSRR
jgi:UDP-glucose 4-epimerase